jgi:hypothetical protein
MTRTPGWQKLPWSLSEIRRIGDWGHASNHLGSAWERHAARRLLEDGQPWASPTGGLFRPSAVVPLGLDETFSARLSAAGQRAPDALVVGLRRGVPIVQPVDFKFSLDHAEAGQVAVDVAVAAGTLLGPALTARLSAALERTRLDDWPDHVVAGCLVAPPSGSNRRTRVPGTPPVRWLPTTVEEFFPPLPAAPVADWLVELDAVGPIRDDFDLAEAYYRLGAAVAGAVGRLARPLFADQAAPAPASLAEIEAWRQVRGIRSAAALVETLRPLLAQRREQERRLHRLLRRPAGRVALNAAVGLPPDAAVDAWPLAARQALLQALADDRALVLRLGAESVAAGATEDEALERLEMDGHARSDRFLRRLRELLG